MALLFSDKAQEARRDQLSAVELRADASHTPDSSVILKYKKSERFVTVGYYDGPTAERIKKALDRWLEICPDREEPF
jgi:hypothetical protein